MKKIFALLLVLLVAWAPMSFAQCPVCVAAASEDYAKSTLGKLGRGITNAGFGWIELFRQPAIRENPWEGVGRGFVHTIARSGSGALEAATSWLPGATIPLPDPKCPLDLLQGTNA